MSDLRSLIREVLSEELAMLRASFAGGPQVERARVHTEAELTEFALSIATRAQDPSFVAALREGGIRFAPESAAPSYAPPPARSSYASQPVASPPVRVVSSTPVKGPELNKGLITERDIAAIADGETRLRVSKTARLTPLAGDEARRRGIRIERTLA